MENLNAEQVKRALECHIKRRCYDCPIGKDDIENFSKPCSEIIAEKSLAIIKSQEQRIKELTERIEELEKGELSKALTFNQNTINNIYAEARADTVRKMQELLAEHATNGYPRKVRLDVLDQIANEMLEGEI